ncbi:type II toxin-antitoxin system Phd/YefM family antitoxin [Pantanalinema rosaneae CENA516]|uniref:type II toxin-antitoxin system Phd/YefM family antitoxin n=1 Tax=Pantanalinema rosaneae TaxID=1620701 RepID=UPI003D6F8EBA
MARIWQLQEAKDQFSEVVDEAIHHGPQVITQHGVEVAIILSSAEYHQMMRSQQKLSEFFHTSPLAEVSEELDLNRDPSPARPDLAL